jgi:phosphatidylserine decarboxylase
LDEFLFGYKDQGKSAVDNIIQSASERGNQCYYMVVYLSPKDYHRYHSPAAFTASYRRHVAGYLEPVDPRYLKGHRDVIKSNERVNLMGDWHHGFFAMSFVGATNVGSIHLHFDGDLATNIKSPVSPYLLDKNYATLMEADGAVWSYP